MIKIGLIDYFLDQYHAHYYPKRLKELSGGEIQVTSAWAKIDKPGGKANSQVAAEGGYALADCPEAVIEQSDCLIVMSPDNAEMHEELCALPLASGKPTYVDKTFAVDRATALRIMDNANVHGTPFFSTSALRYAEEYAALDREGIDFIAARGPGNFAIYAIHLLEPLVALMGVGIESLCFTGTKVSPAFAFRFTDGRAATMAQFGDNHLPFGVTLRYSDGRAADTTVQSDFYRCFLDRMIDFFWSGNPCVPQEETLEIMTVLEYGKAAMDAPGVWSVLPFSLK